MTRAGEAALSYTLQALDIFEHLRSPSRSLALRTIAQLRAEVGETAFARLWQAAGGGRPLPDLPDQAVDLRQNLLQRLLAFIQARTWAESQRILEADSELLSTEADALLQQLAAAQEDENARKMVEQYRELLARCHEVGIAPVFAELQKEQVGETDARGEGITLAELPQLVATVMTQGTVSEQQQLAAELVEVQRSLPSEEAAVATFLGCLVAALRGETPDSSSLKEPLTSLCQQFQNALKHQNQQQDQ